MRRPTKIIASLASLALAAAALASCGGGDEVSPDEYVGSICSAFGEFQSTIVEGQSTVQEAAAGGLDAEQGREQLEAFLGDASEASQGVASRVQDAGAPDVENGQEIADAVNTAFTDVSSAFEEAQSEAAALPTGSDDEFAAAAQELGTTFQSSITQIGEGLDQVGESPELEEAADGNEECQALQTAAGAAP